RGGPPGAAAVPPRDRYRSLRIGPRPVAFRPTARARRSAAIRRFARRSPPHRRRRPAGPGLSGGGCRGRAPSARRSASLQPQRRLRRQPETGLAAAVPVPAAMVPLVTRERVARIQQADQRDLTELSHRKERGGLHLDDKTALLATAAHACRRLA